MNLIFPLIVIRGPVLAYPSGMRLKSLFLITSACLLSSCGSALPESSSAAEKDKRELSDKSPPPIARGDQDNSKQGLSSSGCTELNIGLVELSTQALAGQSLRIPDFSHLGRDLTVFGAPVFRNGSQIQFPIPLSFHHQVDNSREFYFIWRSNCADQEITVAEFQYSRLSLENRIYRGRAHRQVYYHAAQQLWYLPLALALARSDQEAWRSRQLDTDLHRLDLRVQGASGVWRSFEIFFSLNSGGRR